MASEFPQWTGAAAWTGNADADVPSGLAKPRVLDVIEWDDHGWRRQRAEVTTLLPGRPVSPTSPLHPAPTHPPPATPATGAREQGSRGVSLRRVTAPPP